MQTLKDFGCVGVVVVDIKGVWPSIWKSSENWDSCGLVVDFNNYDSLWYNGICGTIDYDIAWIPAWLVDLIN